MANKECRHFEYCSAPLCPMDPGSLEHCAWFPDEEICRRQPALDWIKVQKKLAKRMTFNNGCFTYSMLNQGCMLQKGTKGIDPEKGPIHKQEAAWLEKHPPLSEEYRASRREKIKAFNG